MRGTGATLTGGGGGENHGWTLRGSDLGVIHEDQLLLLSLLLLAFFGEEGDVREEKSREVLERPTLRRAILVVREDIMAVLDCLDGIGNRKRMENGENHSFFVFIMCSRGKGGIKLEYLSMK